MFGESVIERLRWKDPVNITKEQWMMILENKNIVTEKDIQLLKLILVCDSCEATGSQLARLLNMPHHAPLNRQVGQLGKRIVKELNISAPKQKHAEGFNWWNVPFWGEGRKEGFYWILRPELRDAMWEIEEEELSSEIRIPEEIDSDNYENFYEGAIKQVFVNSYERNRGARDRCVKHYGARCIICSFDFEKIYGEVGKDLIHVHHLKPLSEVGKEYKVDPIADLCPLCPNCHVIVHRKNPPYSIDEVIKMINNTRIE